MPLHLIKLCVGCDSVADLKDWIKQKLNEKKKRGQKAEHIHTTRMFPKRAEELTDGGSLYWVIKGQIMCRERILDIRPTTGKDGIKRCQVVLDGKVVLVEPRPRAAFQGWRYLEDKEAPRDLCAPPPAPTRCRRRCGGVAGIGVVVGALGLFADARHILSSSPRRRGPRTRSGSLEMEADLAWKRAGGRS